MLKKFIKLVTLTVLEEMDVRKEIARLEQKIVSLEKSNRSLSGQVQKKQEEILGYRKSLAKRVGKENVKHVMLKENAVETE